MNTHSAIIGIAVLLATGDTCESWSAQEGDFTDAATLNACLKLEDHDLTTALSSVAGCMPKDNKTPTEDLCRSDWKKIDSSSYRRLRNMLLGDARQPNELCDIEATIAVAQRQCLAEIVLESQEGVAAHRISDERLIDELVRLMGSGWRRQGNVERSDKVYCQAFRLANRSHEISAVLAVLKDWADLKVAMGDKAAARELAVSQAELARKEYESDQSSRYNLALLIDALESEAYVFEKLGLQEAEALRQERKELLEKADQCHGLCADEKKE